MRAFGGKHYKKPYTLNPINPKPRAILTLRQDNFLRVLWISKLDLAKAELARMKEAVVLRMISLRSKP